MGSYKTRPAVIAIVDVGIHDVEAGMLQVKVGVDIDDGVVADLDEMVYILVGVHAERGVVSGSIVLGEVAQVGSQLYAEDLGYMEENIQVGIGGEGGQRKDALVARGLIGQFIFPVEDAKGEVLVERETEQLDIVSGLADTGSHSSVLVTIVVGRGREGGVKESVLLDIFHVKGKPCMGLTTGEHGSDARGHLLVKTAVVPP